MSNALKGQIAIITGAAHGMGEAVANTYAAEGAEVGLIDRQCVTWLRCNVPSKPSRVL